MAAEQKHVLSMAEITAEDDVEYAEVPGFKAGQVFRIRSLDADSIITWSEAGEGEAKRTAGIRLIVKSLVDPAGARICDDTHIATWRLKSHKVTERLVKAILELNGMNVKAETAAKNE